MSQQSSQPVPNQYGRIAWNHWRQWNPTRYREIGDPAEFFSAWGDQLAEQVGRVSQSIEDSLTPETGYLERVGQLNMARLRAEEAVLGEQVYAVREVTGIDGEDEEDLPEEPSLMQQMIDENREKMERGEEV